VVESGVGSTRERVAMAGTQDQAGGPNISTEPVGLGAIAADDDTAADDLELVRAIEGQVPGAAPTAAAAVSSAASLAAPVLPQQLQEAMRRLGGQTYVLLERLHVGDLGAECVAKLLASGGGEGDRLKALYLGENDIGDAGATALTAALQRRAPCRLARLYMNDNPRISTSAAHELRRACDERRIALIGLATDGAPPPAKPPSQPASRPRSPLVADSPAAPPSLLMPCNRLTRRPATAPAVKRRAAPIPPAEHVPRFRQTRPRLPVPPKPVSGRSRPFGQVPGQSPPRVTSPYRYDVMPCSRTINHTVSEGALTAALRPGTWAGTLRESIHHNMGTRLINHKRAGDHPWWAEAHAGQGRCREAKGASAHRGYQGHGRPPQHHVRGRPCTAVERLNAVLAAAPR